MATVGIRLKPVSAVSPHIVERALLPDVNTRIHRVDVGEQVCSASPGLTLEVGGPISVEGVLWAEVG
jgi:hypothetical protein